MRNLVNRWAILSSPYGARRKADMLTVEADRRPFQSQLILEQYSAVSAINLV